MISLRIIIMGIIYQCLEESLLIGMWMINNNNNNNSDSYSVKSHFNNLHAHLHNTQYELWI